MFIVPKSNGWRLNSSVVKLTKQQRRWKGCSCMWLSTFLSSLTVCIVLCRVNRLFCLLLKGSVEQWRKTVLTVVILSLFFFWAQRWYKRIDFSNCENYVFSHRSLSQTIYSNYESLVSALRHRWSSALHTLTWLHTCCHTSSQESGELFQLQINPWPLSQTHRSPRAEVTDRWTLTHTHTHIHHAHTQVLEKKKEKFLCQTSPAALSDI